MQTEPPKADAPETAPPRRKRRWFQFSLRSLLMLTLIVGLGMAIWIVPIKNRAERQKAAVQAIIKDGGSVWYDFQIDQPGGIIILFSDREPPGPVWLRRLLGDDFFQTAVGVSFSGQISDGGLENVKRLSQLTGLSLSSTNVNDADLKNLDSVSQLENLDLSHTNVTDLGLERLKGLVRLRTLTVNKTRITDAGLESLSGLSQLQDLTLSQTNVADAGLKHLKTLTQLQTLSLWRTRVTDTGLETLKGLTQLRELDLIETEVTAAGVLALKKSLPNCRIHNDLGLNCGPENGNRDGLIPEPILAPSNSLFGIPDQTLLKYEPLPSGRAK